MVQPDWAHSTSRWPGFHILQCRLLSDDRAYGPPALRRQRMSCLEQDAPGNGYEFRQSYEMIYYGTRTDTPKIASTTQRDIIDCPPVPPQRRLHQSEKPVKLLEILLGYCQPGGAVLDPFMGAGSTIEAAIRTGRPAFGIELEPDIFETAVRRIRNVQSVLDAAKEVADMAEGAVL